MTEHVLVAIDGSDPSWEALAYTAERYADDRITILNIVDPLEGVYGGMEAGYYDPDAFERARERGETICERARERLAEAGVLEALSIETVVEIGRPSRAIVDYATEAEVDHVVIGSHGRGGVSRILLGSVAETVVRRSPVPVTVVR